MMTRGRAFKSMLFGLTVFGLACPALGQADTLADVQADLDLYKRELARLRAELIPSGSASSEDLSGIPLDRVVAIETALQRMTAKVEELEHIVEGVARDGAYRIRDLQWRLCELDAECDTQSLSDLPDPLGGVAAAEPAQIAPQLETVDGEPELAELEKTDFEAAMAALSSAAFAKAASLFEIYRETYPGGPLFPTALVGEGRALAGLGNTKEAARRYLRAYSDYPDAQSAPEALWRLGDALAGLGSTNEACVTLAEVERRYPEDGYVTRAQASLDRLNCS